MYERNLHFLHTDIVICCESSICRIESNSLVTFRNREALPEEVVVEPRIEVINVKASVFVIWEKMKFTKSLYVQEYDEIRLDQFLTKDILQFIF